MDTSMRPVKVLVIALLLVACGRQSQPISQDVVPTSDEIELVATVTPVPDEPTPTSETLVATVAATEAQEKSPVTSEVSTPTPPPTFTQTSTPAASQTPIPYLITLQQLNVRSGPGVVYAPPLGTIEEGARAMVVGQGRSSDGLVWWLIECPPGIVSSQCWVSGGEQYSRAVDADAVPLMPVPPTPTITSSATPNPTPTSTNSPTPTNTSVPLRIGPLSQVGQLPSPTPISGQIPRLDFAIGHAQMVSCPVTISMCDYEPGVPDPAHVTLSAGDSLCLFWLEEGHPFPFSDVTTVSVEIFRDNVLQAMADYDAVGRRVCREVTVAPVAAGDYEVRLTFGERQIRRAWSAR